jgi:hypothetical protein
VLDEWPTSAAGDHQRFTTVASWRGAYGSLTVHGTSYGLKVHEFRRFVAVPRSIPQRVEIALDIHPGDVRDRDLLLDHGWHLVDPRENAGDPESYRAYLAQSGGEFSVAQGIYVGTRSGWFSDRTACYLACGKPVVVQDTGFGDSYPVGEGLLAFSTGSEAIRAAECIALDYQRHSRAARALAERYFDSDVVLSAILRVL